jgi:hypothetical protein
MSDTYSGHFISAATPDVSVTPHSDDFEMDSGTGSSDRFALLEILRQKTFLERSVTSLREQEG